MIPRHRRPGTQKPNARVSAGFDLLCTCGASDWALLRTLEPDDEGRRRAYGCCACGRRIDTREVGANPVIPAEPLVVGMVYCPDVPCPFCANPRLYRSTFLAYDALIARQYDCPMCAASWRTAEILTAGPRPPLPRNARRAARKHALGRGRGA